MSMTELFESFEAPLKNVRWSWGAVDDKGTVFLRQWSTDLVVEGGVESVVVARAHRPDDQANLGWQERKRHLDAVEDGAKCFIVVCEAKDPEARPRQVKAWRDEVLVGGELQRRSDGSTHVLITGSVPRGSLQRRKA